jgi:hypothetical protein
VILQHNFKAFKQSRLNTSHSSSVINKQTSPSQNLSSPEQSYKSQTSFITNESANSSELNALRNQFLQLLYGDQDTCNRLIQFERKQNPHKSEIELYKNAIARLLRDRGH